MSRGKQAIIVKKKLRSILTLCIGFTITGIGSSLYVFCDLGADAFNVLTQGTAATLGLQTGNAFYLAQGVMLAFVAAVRRRYIGIGTLLGTLIVGSIMNLWGLLLAPLLQATGPLVRLCCLATAPLFIAFGMTFARRSGLGMVPNDIVPVILNEWCPRLSFRTVRILCDAAAVVAGGILGGTIGIGTVISVVLTGPCVQFAVQVLSAQTGKRAAATIPESTPAVRHTA